MQVTNIGSKWDQGKLIFFSKITGNEILAFDPETDSVTIPDGVELPNGSLTFAKAAAFVSSQQTGTGAAQNIAHGLGVVPAAVLVVPTDTAADTAGEYTATEGAHTATNVIVTVTTGKKFKVFAWA